MPNVTKIRRPPQPTPAWAPYDPDTGRIYVDKVASTQADVNCPAGCEVIQVMVAGRKL